MIDLSSLFFPHRRPSDGGEGCAVGTTLDTFLHREMGIKQA